MNRIGYATFTALFIGGATAAAAPPHVLTKGLLFEWAIGLSCILLGGLFAGAVNKPFARVLIVAASGVVAWTLLLAVIPLWRVPALSAMMIVAWEDRGAIAFGTLWIGFLSCLCELAVLALRRSKQRRRGSNSA